MLNPDWRARGLYFVVRLADWRDALLAQSPRMSGWWFLAVTLLAGVAWVAPQQLAVVLFKLALQACAAVLGYWVDRCAFPYARPHALLANGAPDRVVAAALLRRALLIGCAMLGVGLGV